jgi:hypothetical protein
MVASPLERPTWLTIAASRGRRAGSSRSRDGPRSNPAGGLSWGPTAPACPGPPRPARGSRWGEHRGLCQARTRSAGRSVDLRSRRARTRPATRRRRTRALLHFAKPHTAPASSFYLATKSPTPSTNNGVSQDRVFATAAATPPQRERTGTGPEAASPIDTGPQWRRCGHAVRGPAREEVEAGRAG